MRSKNKIKFNENCEGECALRYKECNMQCKDLYLFTLISFVLYLFGGERAWKWQKKKTWAEIQQGQWFIRDKDARTIGAFWLLVNSAAHPNVRLFQLKICFIIINVTTNIFMYIVVLCCFLFNRNTYIYMLNSLRTQRISVSFLCCCWWWWLLWGWWCVLVLLLIFLLSSTWFQFLFFHFDAFNVIATHNERHHC